MALVDQLDYVRLLNHAATLVTMRGARLVRGISPTATHFAPTPPFVISFTRLKEHGKAIRVDVLDCSEQP